jgi:hypothetical protein
VNERGKNCTFRWCGDSARSSAARIFIAEFAWQTAQLELRSPSGKRTTANCDTACTSRSSHSYLMSAADVSAQLARSNFVSFVIRRPNVRSRATQLFAIQRATRLHGTELTTPSALCCCNPIFSRFMTILHVTYSSNPIV